MVGDGGQYALRDFISYVGSVEIIFVSVFFREGWQTNKQTKKTVCFGALL